VQVRIGALVSGVMDVAGASPRRFFFEVLQHFASNSMEAERLAYFASPEGKDDLIRYNQREGGSICCRRCSHADVDMLGHSTLLQGMRALMCC
jgi:sulfite reductase alpha subunit-like flavoprotein